MEILRGGDPNLRKNKKEKEKEKEKENFRAFVLIMGQKTENKTKSGGEEKEHKTARDHTKDSRVQIQILSLLVIELVPIGILLQSGLHTLSQFFL